MKTLSIVLMLLIPFIYSEFSFTNSNSAYLAFSQEELLEPEEIKKSEELKKEEPKKEELKEESNIPEPEEDVFKEEAKEIPEHLRYYKEKYELKFNETFQVVWNALKKSVEDISCMIAQEKLSQTDDGLYKGVLKSDFCVFSMGPDTTDKVLKKYSLDFPMIPGAVWITGRIQHSFILKEEPDGSLSLAHKTALSGFEEYITKEVHFWKSNGLLEKRMHESIMKNIEIVKKEEEKQK